MFNITTFFYQGYLEQRYWRADLPFYQQFSLSALIVSLHHVSVFGSHVHVADKGLSKHASYQGI